MGYGTRQPTSNDRPRERSKSRWLEETDLMDETALLINGHAKRCKNCQLAVRVRHLNREGLCPDCRAPKAA